MATPKWAQKRLGRVAEDLRTAVIRALPEAHRDAVAAQVASNTEKRDPYGHTLKNRQYECLVAAARDIVGVEPFQPKGMPFELLRVLETNAVLFPWRYAKDGSVSRSQARMQASRFRRELLLPAGAGASGQLTIEQAALEDEEIQAQFAEEEALVEQLHGLAPVVTIAYASSPSSLHALGWGDGDLVEGTGTVVWRSWEPLPILPSAAVGTASTGTLPPGARLLSLVHAEAIPAPRAPRFDDAPLDPEFGLHLRNPLDGEPQPEAGPRPQQTGEDEEQ